MRPLRFTKFRKWIWNPAPVLNLGVFERKRDDTKEVGGGVENLWRGGWKFGGAERVQRIVSFQRTAENLVELRAIVLRFLRSPWGGGR